MAQSKKKTKAQKAPKKSRKPAWDPRQISLFGGDQS